MTLTQKELMALWNLIDIELEDQDGKYGRNGDYATLGRARKKIIAAFRAGQAKGDRAKRVADHEPH